MSLQNKWYRFRFVVSAVSRSYLYQFKDSNGNVVGPKLCYVIGTDGGYKPYPTAFPKDGLLHGVAERYEVVCDFSQYGGQSLYLTNGWDSANQPSVPYFCYSHLLARLDISKTFSLPLDPSIVFDPTVAVPEHLKFEDLVLSPVDYAAAKALANSGKSDRQFALGRCNGHWCINGETWDTFKIAAMDVGQNTYEVWEFDNGGGWFHPLHMHLVDFFVIRRDGSRGVMDYELDSPKDVFYLGPSNKLWVLARFGSHKGDYMFHGHNLIHEDNDMLRAFHMVDGQNGRPANQPSA
jgi:FtsP/CotA-like multicopper oxidase with cupredoxin domain